MNNKHQHLYLTVQSNLANYTHMHAYTSTHTYIIVCT